MTIHNLSARGGQERTMLENLTRLARAGFEITVYAYNFSDWPTDLPVKWRAVPGKSIPTNLLKNLWFGLVTYFMLRQEKGVIISAGTCSWRADIRVIHFVHATYHDLVKSKLAPYPNARTIFHTAYQMLFASIEVFLERKLFKSTKQFIAVSKRIKTEIENIVHGPVNVEVIHHAADEYESPPKKRPLRLLFVGALERKGIDKLLRILAQQANRDWHCDVVGAGNISKWKKQASDLGLSQKITFHGHTNAKKFFGESEILIFPSLYEPFGMVITEAVSADCFALASNECGAMELWPSRPQWLDLSAQSHDDLWIEALARLLDDNDLRTKLLADFKQSLKLWSWDQAAKKYADVVLNFD